MKIKNKALLALCAFHPTVWGTAAFVVKPSKTQSSVALHSSRDQQQQVTTSTGRKDVASVGSRSRSNLARATEGRKVNWDALSPVSVQGGSLKTWSFTSPEVERVQVLLKTDGRPLNALVELWQGPDNTPQKVGVFVEDGGMRNFRTIVETPRSQNAICVRNTAPMEFPLYAAVEESLDDDVTLKQSDQSVAEIIQGGSLKTFSFAPSVESVRVCLRTDGRPLNAKIELLQGPNTNKQVMDIYTEDGVDRPFYAIIETPGSGNVVRIVNTAPMEFPLNALVEPYVVEPISNEPRVF